MNKFEYMFSSTNHYFNCFWEHGVYPGTIFFLLCIGFTFRFFALHAYYLWQRLQGTYKQSLKDSAVTQKLEPFFSAVRPAQMRSSIKEETVCREKLGFKRLPDSTYEKLREASTQTPKDGEKSKTAGRL